MRANIRSDSFWCDTREVLAVLEPLLRNLKFADESRPLLGFVRPMMLDMHRKMQDLLTGDDYCGSIPLAERSKAVNFVMSRWSYLHRPVHSAAYVLNPRLHGVDHFADPEVRADFGVNGPRAQLSTVAAHPRRRRPQRRGRAGRN